jgi:hypothetical protein
MSNKSSLLTAASSRCGSRLKATGVPTSSKLRVAPITQTFNVSIPWAVAGLFDHHWRQRNSGVCNRQRLDERRARRVGAENQDASSRASHHLRQGLFLSFFSAAQKFAEG